MLIGIFDQLMSGKRIHRLVFTNGDESIAAQGLKVDYHDCMDNADAWVCWDDTGIWLSSNADVHGPDGYHGKQGREDPLSSIEAVSFMPE